MKRRKKPIKKSDITMDIIVTVILIVITLLCIYPVWYVFAASFSSTSELMLNPGFMLCPKKVVTGAYQMVLENQRLLSGLKNSVMIL